MPLPDDQLGWEVLSIAQSRKSCLDLQGEQDHDLDIVVSPSPDTGTQIQQCLIACQMNKDKLQSIITLLLVDNCLCFAIFAEDSIEMKKGKLLYKVSRICHLLL